MSSASSHFTIRYTRKLPPAKRGTKYESSSKRPTIADISIPGFSKVFNRDQPLIAKVFWFLAIALCFVFSLYQVSKRIEYYLSNPTTATVSVNDTYFVDYPAMGICAGPPVFECMNSKLFRERYEEYFQEPKNCTDSDVQNILFSTLRLTLNQIWADVSVNGDDIEILSSCHPIDEDEEICNPTKDILEVSKEYIDTMAGRCLVIRTKTLFKYHGAATSNIEIRLKHPNFTQHPIIALMYFHQKDVKEKFNVVLDSLYIPRKRDSSVRIDNKRFIRKNRPQHQCWEKATASMCAHKCISNYLKDKINCSLPFVESYSKKQCSTWGEYKLAWQTTMNAFNRLNRKTCPCKPDCDDIKYSNDIIYDDPVNDTYTTVTVAYKDSIIETVEETFLYDFSALLSDIGGNLGFFVGICVLTIIEILEAVARGVAAAF